MKDENTQMILEALSEFREDFQGFKNDMTDFKGDMLAFKDDMTGFKGNMLSFKDDMTSFKDDMLIFKGDMTDFKGDMLSFKNNTESELKDIKASVARVEAHQPKDVAALLKQMNEVKTMLQDSMDALNKRMFRAEGQIERLLKP